MEDQEKSSSMQAFGSMGGFPVTRLNENNYQTWSVKAEMFPRKEELWQIVNNPPAALDEEEQRKNEKALSTIILCLEDSQLTHVSGLTSIKEFWDTLKRIYVHDSAGSKVSLTRKLYKAKLEENESMSHHLQKMKNLFNELQQRNMDFTESHKAYIILSSLPESYDVLVTSLESMPDRDLTLQYLTSRLLEEARKRSERSENRRKHDSPQ